MYGQSIDLKISSLYEMRTLSFECVLFKEIKVDKGEEWQDLLINVASSACRESFRKIFNHFYPLLIAQGIKSGISKEVSTELAQETMIRVWGHASSFDPSKGNATLWIYVISRNLKYDYLRKLKNDPLQPSSKDIYFEENSILWDEGNIDALFDLGQLKKQIQNLSSEQQDVIHKIYFEGMTQQEIAKECRIPIGTVKSRVRLAIATLKKMMEEE